MASATYFSVSNNPGTQSIWVYPQPNGVTILG